MKALKALVVVMGILIVLGIGLVVYGLLTQFGKGGEAVATAPAVTPPMAEAVPVPGPAAGVVGRVPAEPFGSVLLDEPADTAITGASAGDGRILLRLSGGGKPDRVVVLRGDDGSVLGTIGLGAPEQTGAQ